MVALAHSGLTAMIYDSWRPAAVWFLGTGLGLLLLAVMNWAQVGLGPCEQPTAPVVPLAGHFTLRGPARRLSYGTCCHSHDFTPCP